MITRMRNQSKKCIINQNQTERKKKTFQLSIPTLDFIRRKKFVEEILKLKIVKSTTWSKTSKLLKSSTIPTIKTLKAWANYQMDGRTPIDKNSRKKKKRINFCGKYWKINRKTRKSKAIMKMSSESWILSEWIVWKY